MNPRKPRIAIDNETPGDDQDDKREVRHQDEVCRDTINHCPGITLQVSSENRLISYSSSGIRTLRS